MIAFVEGKIAEKQPTRVVVEVGGVGYEIFIPLSSYDRMAGVGEKCRLLTCDYQREEAHQLFGFITGEERHIFTLLLGITGIGPKLALSALSGLSVEEFRRAVAERDVKRISSISGVGRKTAERIVLELHDALGEIDDARLAAAGGDSRMNDAVLALTALGYREDAARKMVKSTMGAGADSKIAVEEIIKRALGG
ncbi:MAG: Holliday junction branch migration protein RuvA [Kiritimatiellia bacterium]